MIDKRGQEFDSVRPNNELVVVGAISTGGHTRVFQFVEGRIILKTNGKSLDWLTPKLGHTGYRHSSSRGASFLVDLWPEREYGVLHPRGQRQTSPADAADTPPLLPRRSEGSFRYRSRSERRAPFVADLLAGSGNYRFPR